MKKISLFLFLAFFIASAVPFTVEAYGPGKGEWTGWLIMDPWGSMWFCNFCYIYPIDKELVPKLKAYAGRAVVLNVEKVYSLVDPGPTKIVEADYVKGATFGELKALELWFSIDTYEIKGNQLEFSLTVKNNTDERARFIAAQLTYFILKKESEKAKLLVEMYDRSVPIRECRYVDRKEIKKEIGSITMGNNTKYDTLAPGEEYRVSISQNLPDGEYYIFAGYGESNFFGPISLKSNGLFVKIGGAKDDKEFKRGYISLYQKADLPDKGTQVPHPKNTEIKYYYYSHYPTVAKKTSYLQYGLYMSKNGGITWIPLCMYLDFQGLFIHPETEKLFAVIWDEWLKEDDDGYLKVATADKVLMSEDGRQWKDITGGNGHISTIGKIFVDPDNPGRVCLLVCTIRGYVLQSVDDDYSAWTWYREDDWDKRKDEKIPRVTK
jgi:hypothetical protein